MAVWKRKGRKVAALKGKLTVRRLPLEQKSKTGWGMLVYRKTVNFWGKRKKKTMELKNFEELFFVNSTQNYCLI